MLHTPSSACPAAPLLVDASQQSHRYVTHPSTPESHPWPDNCLLQAQSSSLAAAYTRSNMYARAPIIFQNTHSPRNASTPSEHKTLLNRHTIYFCKHIHTCICTDIRTQHFEPVNILSDMQEKRYYLPSSALSRNRMSSSAHARKNAHTHSHFYTLAVGGWVRKWEEKSVRENEEGWSEKGTQEKWIASRKCNSRRDSK